MNKFDFKDFLNFKKLVTPSMLKYFYWFFCVVIIVNFIHSLYIANTIHTIYDSAFSSFLGGMSRYNSAPSTGFFYFFYVVELIVRAFFYFIGLRISFELVIILFRINSNLQKIVDKADENGNAVKIDKDNVIRDEVSD